MQNNASISFAKKRSKRKPYKKRVRPTARVEKKHTISYMLYSMEISLHIVLRRPHHIPLKGVSRR